MRVLRRAQVNRRRGLINVVRADIGVNSAVLNNSVGRVGISNSEEPWLLHTAQKSHAACGHVLSDRSGGNVAGDNCFGLGIDAQFARVAVVVDVVATVWSEEIVGRCTTTARACGLVPAAVRVDHVVVDERMTEAGSSKSPPPVR